MTISQLSTVRTATINPVVRPQSGGASRFGFSVDLGIGPYPRVPDARTVGGIANLITLQRNLSDFTLRVELVAKVAEALSGSIRKLTQG